MRKCLISVSIIQCTSEIEGLSVVHSNSFFFFSFLLLLNKVGGSGYLYSCLAVSLHFCFWMIFPKLVGGSFPNMHTQDLYVELGFLFGGHLPLVYILFRVIIKRSVHTSNFVSGQFFSGTGWIVSISDMLTHTYARTHTSSHSPRTTAVH